MNDKKRETYTKKLLEKRDELIDELEDFEKTTRNETSGEHTGEISTMTTHPADMVATFLEQEQEFDFASREGEMLQDIEDALKRMEKGTYGKCLRCGKDIGEARLEAIPYASLCITCKTELEKGKEE